MKTSAEWAQYFASNLKNQRINWNQYPSITDAEKGEIIKSLRAWQLGETSEGKQLMKASVKYAKKYNDPDFIDAVSLFIKEEQKHGANLGTYIDLIGEQRATKDVGDSMFRFVRHLMLSMEMWTMTVLVIENAAQVFYQALKDATNCNLLKEVCTDILIDEARHIEFQVERMSIIFSRRAKGLRTPTLMGYSFFHFVVIRVIWMSHKRSFIAGGVNKKQFIRKMNHKFNRTFGQLIRVRFDRSRIKESKSRVMKLF